MVQRAPGWSVHCPSRAKIHGAIPAMVQMDCDDECRKLWQRATRNSDVKNMNKNSKRRWRLNLHSGDEVTIDSGQNESTWPSVIIESIEYLPYDTVRILTKDGERIECALKKIS